MKRATDFHFVEIGASGTCSDEAIHGQFECRQSLSRYEVYCHERKRSQLGRCSRCDHERPAVSHLPHQQIHRPVPAPKRENPLRVHGQKNTLLQNQKGGCDCLSGKPQGVPRKLLRPGGLVQRRLYCPDGETGSPNRAGAFASVLYRAALRLSRCADHTSSFQNHRLRKNRHQQLVQSGAHQVFPEKQCQPYSEGLFGGVLLFHLLSHHHPQIAVACSGAETLPGLEKSETDGRRRKEKSLAY